MGTRQVLTRRRAERAQLLDRARDYVDRLRGDLPVLAAVVYGSTARGDFNLWSDVDVLLIVADLPERHLDRLDLLHPRPPRVEPIAWTSGEWRDQLARRNPIALEAARRGVWLYGSADEWVDGDAEGLGEM